MSIASAIETLRGRISDAYDAAEEKGATIPSDANLANLASTIATITGGGGTLPAPECRTIAPNVYWPGQGCDPSDGYVVIVDNYQEYDYLLIYGAAKRATGYTSPMDALIQTVDHFVPYCADSSFPEPTLFWTSGTYGGDLVGVVVIGKKGDAFSPPSTVYGSCACLLKNTRISLANKTTKPIQNITYDDDLLIWNFDEGKFDSAKPIWIKKTETLDYYYHNKFKSGKTLDTTGKNNSGAGHRIFDLERNRFEYDTESIDRECFTLDGSDIHESCVKVNEPCEYYNIITDKHFNMFANGILTSCSLNNLYPIKDMKFDKSEHRELKPYEAYDVPLEFYKGLRLAESTKDINEVNAYVNNLVRIKA